MLRDQLICGINDDRIQRRLLAKTKSDFTKALAVAQAMETAEREAQHLQSTKVEKPVSTTEEAVHNTSSGDTKRWGGGSSQNSYRCGGKHRPSSYRHL